MDVDAVERDYESRELAEQMRDLSFAVQDRLGSVGKPATAEESASREALRLKWAAYQQTQRDQLAAMSAFVYHQLPGSA